MADLDLQPTQQMADNAARGLELREKHGKGGTAVGVARARDIKNRKNLSPETVKRMHSFFSRHEGNQAGGEDDAGYIAWLLWGGDAGKAWAARKAAQIDKSESARFSHDIRLPKGKRRLNIDEAHAALAQMGYRLGTVRYDPAAGGSVYKVSQPNGSVIDMPAVKLTDFIYEKAKNMKSDNDRPGAKSKFQKLSEHMNHIVALCDKVLAVLYRESPDKSLGGVWAKTAQDVHEIKATAHQISRQSWAYSRPGSAAKFGQVGEMLSQIESQSHDQRDLAKSNLRKLAAKIADIDHTREEWDRYVRVAKSLGYTESQIAGFSRAGQKVRFNMAEQHAALAKAIDNMVVTAVDNGLSRLPEVMRARAVRSNISASYGDKVNAWAYLKRALQSRSLLSRTGSRAMFEKSDDYARILMQPVTPGNCGKMSKIASEAIKYAKSVGDDDLLELAEEIAFECKSTKSRASRKEAR